MSNNADKDKKRLPGEIPEIIIDSKNGKTYRKGKFLGKGGFAKCYELMDISTKEIFAGKIVPKSLLQKQHQKEKMTQEITIHRVLNHQHIVKFYSFFEDSENVYIILELCRRRSLMELHKRRKAISEPETRYFIRQILLGIKHIHNCKLIHRDLKLGNLFINDEMEIKIGDFGLATKVDFEGERKKTLCGTPNYIAPEILCKKGHSYEVDVWSIGCILYTLLVGKPPFETQTLKDTYKRIKSIEYHIPARIGPLARNLIQKLLQGEPSRRPSVDDILNDEFMILGFMPQRLPTSCLTMAPRFDAHHNSSILAMRKPLGEINTKDGSPLKVSAKAGLKKGVDPAKTRGDGAGPLQQAGAPTVTPVLKKPSSQQLQDEEQQQLASLEAAARMKPEEPADGYINELYAQISSLVQAKPDEKEVVNEDEAEDPAAVPMVWISKWVDYSDKYGLGYQLSDDSIGVLFNDFTKLLLLPDMVTVNYIERNGQEHYHKISDYPKTLHKKVTLLCYFRTYMNEHLLKAAASMAPRDGDELARIPSLSNYFRTRSAIILHLTNGTFQINFFEDHTKVILCPLMGAVTYIDKKANFRTFKLKLLEEFGCSPDLAHRLRYAKSMIQKTILMKPASSRGAGSSSSARSHDKENNQQAPPKSAV